MVAMISWRCGVKKSSKLPDDFYDKQIERMSGLQKFPLLPMAQKEIRRALRRIAETDGDFITSLISEVVDTATICPTPADLITMAGAKRHRTNTSVGKANCDRCQGSGFVTTVRTVSVPGIQSYETEFAAVCACRGGR
jgi:hypothetical protein